MSRIYLATSWRNEHYDRVLWQLRNNGHEVYDFRDPEGKFQWSAINPNYMIAGYLEQAEMLKDPEANRGFGRDKDALNWCDVLVMLYPCGNDAHVELGYAAGQGKFCIVYLKPGYTLGLMDKVADLFVSTDQQLLEGLR